MEYCDTYLFQQELIMDLMKRPACWVIVSPPPPSNGTLLRTKQITLSIGEPVKEVLSDSESELLANPHGQK